MIMQLPESVHHALVADTASAMARRTPAVSKAIAEIRAEENARRIASIPQPTTAFDLFVEETP